VKIKLLSLALLVSLLQGACVRTLPITIQAPEPTREEEKSHSVHWAYEGEGGPEHWGELDSSYEACKSGEHRSPVNIVNPDMQDLANIAFHYWPSNLQILNNGHTVQVNYDSGSYIELDGQRYDVLQYHYHAPSEHTIEGKFFAAEFHIVHKNSDGKLAVVGILLDEGEENAAFQPLLSNLPAQQGQEKDLGIQINVADFLPMIQTTYRYSGSLTTPPCTEGVSWLVMATPIQVSADQMAALTGVFEGNNRPVQPLNTRLLVEDSTP
jgi:carbonic anhydrase